MSPARWAAAGDDRVRAAHLALPQIATDLRSFAWELLRTEARVREVARAIRGFIRAHDAASPSLWRYIADSYERHDPRPKWWDRRAMERWWREGWPEPPCLFIRLAAFLAWAGFLTAPDFGYTWASYRLRWAFWRPSPTRFRTRVAIGIIFGRWAQ